MKRILYLNDNNIFTNGGSQKSTMTIVKEMAKLNYEVGIFMLENENYNKTIDKNVSIFYYKKRTTNRIKYYKYKLSELRKCINQFKPDIIHSQNPNVGLMLGILSKKKLIDPSIKVIHHDRGFFLEYTRLYQYFMKKLANSYDLIITTTKRNERVWKEKTKINNIKTVTNVLDDDWFEYDEKIERELKSKYNVDNKINIGFAGRFDKCKMWFNTLKICKKLLNDKRYIFTFAIVPSGDMEDKYDEFISKLKDMLGDRLILLINADLEKMKEFYYILDIYVLTSKNESFGRTLIEAMTKNNVVFGTNSGGVPDVINNSDYLYEVEDIDTIVNKIIDCSNEKIIDKKKYFLNYVKDNFDIKLFVKKLVDIYNN